MNSFQKNSFAISCFVQGNFPSNVVFDYIVYLVFSHADQILAFDFQNG